MLEVRLGNISILTKNARSISLKIETLHKLTGDATPSLEGKRLIFLIVFSSNTSCFSSSPVTIIVCLQQVNQ